jgi:cytochrome c553
LDTQTPNPSSRNSILVLKSCFSRLTNFRSGNRFLLPALLAALSPALAMAETPSGDVPPPWAYPVDPPGVKAPKDDGTLRHVPNSTLALTLSQVRDGFVSPDWHPNDHPPLTPIVAHGRKPEVMACGYCHRAEGTGGPENASLAGLPAAYIIQQMQDFKSGTRSTSLPERAPQKNMMALAKKVTPAEVEEAAAYFSSLKLRPIMRVIEAEMVPQTYVHGWHLADLKNGQKEPIGQRIIEMPEDLEQFVSRDAHSVFVAYVPPGSIEKGRILATTGGGRTIQCTICHGPDLRGLSHIDSAAATGKVDASTAATFQGPIPGIAGRSPTYIVRQLFDIQHGARTGSDTALMKPTVEKLTMEDMIDLAAYASSLQP